MTHDPIKMLRCILDNSDFFRDPYYADLRNAIFEQAETILALSKENK